VTIKKRRLKKKNRDLCSLTVGEYSLKKELIKRGEGEDRGEKEKELK